MKFTLLRLLPFVFAVAMVRADDAQIIAAVRAAADAHAQATKTANHDAIMAGFSEELHYVHANGQVDTKESYGKRNHLLHPIFDFKERKFIVAAPGIVVETGRVLSQWKRDDRTGPLTDARFLCVWRQENGQWHMFAWEAASIPTAEATKKK